MPFDLSIACVPFACLPDSVSVRIVDNRFIPLSCELSTLVTYGIYLHVNVIVLLVLHLPFRRYLAFTVRLRVALKLSLALSR